MSNIYEEIWKKYDLNKAEYPTRANKVIELEYEELAKNINNKNSKIFLRISHLHFIK